MEFCKKLVVEHSKTVMINSLLESSAGIPQDILDTDPYPSDLHMALFANMVKTVVKMSEETDAEYGMRLNLSEGWRLLVTGRSCLSDTTEYFGATFVHAESQQVVVVHQGIIPSTTQALYTEAFGIPETTGIISSAVSFMESIRQVVHSANVQHGRSYNVAITGHLLGGWLAQITAFTVKSLMASSGVHAKTVVFDSPGAKAVLIQMRDNQFKSQAVNVSLESLNITIYVLAPNRFNIQGEHLGKIHRVFIDVPKVTVGNKISFTKYKTKTYGMNNFIQAFRCDSPEIGELADWAEATAEFFDLFDTSKPNQNKDIQCEKLNRYNMAKFESQIDDKIVKGDFNYFAEDELTVLYMLYFLQEKKLVVKFLEAFVSQNMLQREERLFPDFEIDLYNKIIMCTSRKSLDTLNNRLKQLMRWLEPQFSEAVVEEIGAFHRDVTIERRRQNVDSLYRAEETRYLDSLPKTSLNFNDSIGLKNFLVSDTDRVLCMVTQDGALEMTRLHNIFSQLKKNVDMSDPIYKYTRDGQCAFLDWPSLQKLSKMYGSPIDQSDLMIVDGVSSPTMSLEDCTFLNNYLHCSSPNMKKLVFISSKQIETFKFLENIKIFIAHRNINLTDLSDESQNILVEKIKSGEFP